MSTITTSSISSILDTSTTTALSTPDATSVSHTFPPFPTYSHPPPYRGPGDGRPKSGQPNLIFGFVVAFLLIFIIVMGGGMAARVYGERQRRAAAAAGGERGGGPGADAPPPPTHEVWLNQANSPSQGQHSWGSMRPLTASLVPKQIAAADPTTATSNGSVPAPPRELYAGRMIGRGVGMLPLLPAQLSSTSTTAKRSKEAATPEETVLSAAVLVRMPDPISRTYSGPGQEIELKRAQPAERLASLEIGLCELPWRGSDLR
ncbi:hypothetical protein AURDEDRAFT_179935 [Auricularia subglabra TFB-10046 SS5]|nr:hypothetical protein AURDEDRAFT_179935 [Auricularia subglabra TFB-10046 SS5]